MRCVFHLGLLLLLTPAAASPKSAHVAEAHGVPKADESRGHNRSSKLLTREQRRAVPPPKDSPEASHATADFFVVSAAFLVASFVHGIAGFGAGIVAMSIVPLQLPVMEAVPIVAVFSLCICAGLALQLRNALGNPSVRPVMISLVVGCVVGVPLGGMLLTRADPRWLRIALGLCMLLFVAERVMHDDGGATAERMAYAAVAEGDVHALRPVALHLGRSVETQAEEQQASHEPSPLASPSASPRLLSRVGRSMEAEDPPASPKGKKPRRRAIDHPLVGTGPGLGSGSRSGLGVSVRVRGKGQERRVRVRDPLPSRSPSRIPGSSPHPTPVPEPNQVGIGVGLASGVLGGALNEAGPPAAEHGPHSA